MSNLRNLLLTLFAWLALMVAAPAVAADGPTISAAPEEIQVRPGADVVVPDGWSTVHGIYADVHGPPRHARLLEQLSEHVDGSAPELMQRLELPLGSRVDVFLSSTDDQFRAVQPGTPPAWADATAYPSLGAIYLRAPLARQGDQEPLTTVLDHELVHIVVGRAFAPERPPTWLQEGLAQFHAEQHDLQTVQKLASAAFSGPIPLDRLEHAFPRNPHQATLAYAESVDFLVWMERTYGPESVPALVRALKDGADMPDAVLTATGDPLYEVDRAWRDRFTAWDGLWWSALSSWDGVWLFTALLGMVAMFVVRRRERRRRREIAAREAQEEELLQAIWEGRFHLR